MRLLNVPETIGSDFGLVPDHLVRGRLRSITMMDGTGDTTIVWSEDQDADIEAAIEAKMRDGCIFFIIEDRHLNPPPLTMVKPENLKTIHEKRALLVKDQHFAALVGTGKAVAIKTPPARAVSIRKAKTPKEVATGGQSVGVPRRVGG